MKRVLNHSEVGLTNAKALKLKFLFDIKLANVKGFITRV